MSNMGIDTLPTRVKEEFEAMLKPKVIVSVAERNDTERKDKVLLMIDEAERNFDSAIVSYSRGMERLFNILEILAKQNAGKSENYE